MRAFARSGEPNRRTHLASLSLIGARLGTAPYHFHSERDLVLHIALGRRHRCRQLVRTDARRRAIAGVAIARRDRDKVDGFLGLAVPVGVGPKLESDQMTNPILVVEAVGARQLAAVTG